MRKMISKRKYKAMRKEEKIYKIELVSDSSYCPDFDLRTNATTFLDFFRLGYTVEQSIALSNMIHIEQEPINTDGDCPVIPVHDWGNDDIHCILSKA